LNRFIKPRMKSETIQTILNWFKASLKDIMIRFKQFWIDSYVIRFKIPWNDSPQVRDFGWYDSTKSDLIQKCRKIVLIAEIKLLGTQARKNKEESQGMMNIVLLNLPTKKQHFKKAYQHQNIIKIKLKTKQASISLFFIMSNTMLMMLDLTPPET